MSDTNDFGHDSMDHTNHDSGSNDHVSHTYKEPNFAVHAEYPSDISSGNTFTAEQFLNVNTKVESKIIGLTGGIGSGKTTVAKFIEEFGFPVYYSDDRAKDIVNENDDLKAKIKELLGNEAYDENGHYNRKFVADQVFNNKDLLHNLNEIIHPAVRIDFEDWVKKQTKYLVFKETALLFELKLNKQCYKSVLVTAEDNIRAKRVMDRDGKTYREVEAVMEKQMPEKDKIKLADCIIYNNTNLEDLKDQTERIIFDIE